VDLESTHRQKKLVVHSVEINQTLEYAFQQASASTSKRINKQAHQQASASTSKRINKQAHQQASASTSKRINS
jgi:hypothetical protein